MLFRSLYPNPDDCHSYWHCSNNIAYLKECPADLHFNQSRQRCDRPEAAKCDPRYPVTPRTTPTPVSPDSSPRDDQLTIRHRLNR